eukprot:355101-Chlamydomonas_euryale.AAC.12
MMRGAACLECLAAAAAHADCKDCWVAAHQTHCWEGRVFLAQPPPTSKNYQRLLGLAKSDEQPCSPQLCSFLDIC